MPLQYIRYGDMIRSCKSIQINTGERPEGYGLSVMEKFQKAITFIIKTITRKTTILPIWNVSQLSITSNIIGRRSQFLQKIVTNVIKSIKQKSLGQNFVQITVSQQVGHKQGLIMSKGFVLNAKRNSGLINTLEQLSVQCIVMRDNMFVKKSRQNVNSVEQSLQRKIDELSGAPTYVVSVTPVAKKRKVYNISVEGEEEYFANGILTHNYRYIIMSRFPAPLKRSIGDSIILPEERKNMNLITAPMREHGDEMLGSFHQGGGAITQADEMNDYGLE